MFLQAFHQREGDTVTITRAQASRFAKSIADDFNPLHDEDAKRFCVPGDLLFALILRYYGLSESMRFRFTGMVAEGTELLFTATDAAQFAIVDGSGKAYLEVERSGQHVAYDENVEAFLKDYVAFSGRNFPHILVPLMQAQDVMINPARPMVMYESMAFEVALPLQGKPQLNLSKSDLQVDGKRGEADLRFTVMCEGEQIGQGTKHLLLSGLRTFDGDLMGEVCNDYDQRKVAFKA